MRALASRALRRAAALAAAPLRSPQLPPLACHAAAAPPPAPLPHRPRALATRTPAAAACWSCGAARGVGDLYFCGNCHVILPPDASHDHFALLSSPRAFDLPPPALEAAYKAAAKALHPDKFSARPEAERQHSAAQAARLNAAYAVLRAPLSRARYLLRLQGALASDEATIADGALLAEVMEAREAAAEARGDAAALAALAERAAASLAACEAALRDAFAAGDLRAAAGATTRLAYLTKLADDVAESRHDAAAQAEAAGDAARRA